MIALEKKITIAVVVGLSASTAIALSCGIWSYYSRRSCEQVHGLFERHYVAFERVLQSEDNSEQAQELARHVADDYERYKRTAFAPFFLALQAELYTLIGKHDDALIYLENALSKMPSSPQVLFYTYDTKHALMQIESAEPAIQTRGRQKLERLALDVKNPVRDMALFYMGYQAFMDNDSQGVQSAWGKLFDAQKKPLSLWGFRAQALLNYTA